MKKQLLAVTIFAGMTSFGILAAAQARPGRPQSQRWQVAPKDPLNPTEKMFAIPGEYYKTFTPTLPSRGPYFQVYCDEGHFGDGKLDTGFVVEAEPDSDGGDNQYSPVVEKLQWHDGYSSDWDYDALYENPTTLGFGLKAMEALFTDEKYGSGYNKWLRPANTVLIEATEWPQSDASL